jgi:hypothetical protein
MLAPLVPIALISQQFPDEVCRLTFCALAHLQAEWRVVLVTGLKK